MARRHVSLRDIVNVVGDSAPSPRAARFNARTLLRLEALRTLLGPLHTGEWANIVASTTAEIQDASDVKRLLSLARKTPATFLAPRYAAADPLTTHLEAAAGVAVLCARAWPCGADLSTQFLAATARDLAERVLHGEVRVSSTGGRYGCDATELWHQRVRAMRAEYLYATQFATYGWRDRIASQEGDGSYFGTRVANLREAFTRDLILDLRMGRGRVPLAGPYIEAGATLVGLARLVGLMCSTLLEFARPAAPPRREPSAAQIARAAAQRRRELFGWLRERLNERCLGESTTNKVWVDASLRVLHALRRNAPALRPGDALTAAARIVYALELDSDTSEMDEDDALPALVECIRRRDERHSKAEPEFRIVEDAFGGLGIAPNLKAERQRRARASAKPPPKLGARNARALRGAPSRTTRIAP